MLHLSLLIAASLVLHFSHETFILGNNNNNILTSYIYKKTISLEKTSSTQSQQTHITKSDLLSKESLLKTKNAKQENKNNHAVTKQNTQTAAAASRGQEANELLTLLHTAIQNQQQYPPSA